MKTSVETFKLMVETALTSLGYTVHDRPPTTQDAIVIPFEINGGLGNVVASGREIRIAHGNKEAMIALAKAKIVAAVNEAKAA